MISILKDLIAHIFHINTYEELARYLLKENEMLRKRVAELEYTYEIDLVATCKEAGIDPETLKNVGV